MIMMKKNEFLAKLKDELKKNNVADIDEIISEYEQHFAFKMADGYSEEEIAARLGDPLQLASQFESNIEYKTSGGKKIAVAIGLVFTDIFTGAFFILLVAWEIIMAAFAVSNLVIAACLFGRVNFITKFTPMPYLSAVVIGISAAALAVLSVVGCIYFALFIRQLMRAYGRFHRNTMAIASGGAVLPPLAIYPRLPAKVNRRLRSVALFAMVVFTTSFVLGMIISMLLSGSIEFWHTWGWFGYNAVN